MKNRVGAIPMRWYEEYDHIGYDVDGKKIVKKQGPSSDSATDHLDQFLKQKDNPDWYRTVYDEINGEEVVLSHAELDLIDRIRAGQYAHSDFDPYDTWVEFDYPDGKIHPIGSEPEPKRRFLPSKWEAKKITKLVKAIREGRIKPPPPKAPEVYDLWADENDEENRRGPPAIAPPKVKPPSHAESYNPPAEYLPTKEEVMHWNTLDPEDRPHSFVPQKFDALRRVPLYSNFIRERFDRCLDLYLCPRAAKKKLNIDPESLIPKLPKPSDLRPFPTSLSITYNGHEGRVRSLSVDPSGQWLATGSDDRTVRVFEVETGRCFCIYRVPDIVYAVAWNPNPDLHLLAVACGDQLRVYNPGLVVDKIIDQTDESIGFDLEAIGEDEEDDTSAQVESVKKSAKSSGEEKEEGEGEEEEMVEDDESAGKESGDKAHRACAWKKGRKGKGKDMYKKGGLRMVLQHNKPVKSITWHHKGDYFATVCPEASPSTQVLIHSLTRKSTQLPFSKNNGIVQKVAFHPSKPYFFAATQTNVRVYNLQKQELVKKLLSGCKHISSISIHPNGDNVIIGSYDKKLCWFDLDLASTPYKTLRYHHMAIRSVQYHKKLPLFASASDDGHIHVFHGMVYDDLLQNPLIVPVKILRGHETAGGLGVLDCVFHPTQPWIFSAGADKSVRLWVA
eukprot:GILI01004181.1.p1 GENE.GILI01004181.1~~GILI01004181.1.p1  ORF type:complete len:673 (+),score=203.38 GILI01004181.1:721-2739(+)